MNEFTTEENLTFFYKGLDLNKGKLPAFFYFALTAHESLNVEPYNTPVTFFEGLPVRVFTITLPCHYTKSSLESNAIKCWGEEIDKGNYILEEFIVNVSIAIKRLIAQRIVDPENLALGGLSRGAFIATHVASKVIETKYLLGFAPLTYFNNLEDFQPYSEDRRFQDRLEKLNLLSLIETLTHLRHLRFYIGNRDIRVGTEHCFHFIRQLAEKAHEKHARHFLIDLFITNSIGHKGHGTSPATFQEGSLWLKKLLLKD